MKPDEIKPGIRKTFELAGHRPEEAGGDANAELDAVLDEQIRYLISRGLAPADARARVLGAAGSDARTRLHRSAEHRERRMKLHEWLDDLAQDLRHAFRAIKRSPSLAVAATLTLALAIGANTAIFSAVSAVMLRPLPFTEPDRLVMLWEENPDYRWYMNEAAPANMLDWKERAGVFSDVAAYSGYPSTTTLTGRGEPRLLKTQTATGNFFDVLGVRAELGRTFRPEETWNNVPRVVLLTHRTWRTVFNADRSLIGKTVQLGGRDVEVVGVLPERFTVPGVDTDIWMPVRWDPASRTQVFFRRAHWLRVVARLQPGVTSDGADAALQAVVKQLQIEYPQTNTRMGAGLTPLHEFLVGTTKLPLLVMFGAVAVLLLIACANVANLLLVRAAGRERESAVRLALGAGRSRLLRQSVAESAVFAGLGGVAGVVLGWWGTRVLAALQPAGMLPVTDVAVSWPVLGYALGATVLSALIFAIAPTVWTMRRVPADVLRDEGRTASGTLRARRWGESLLVVQVALAIALTLGAGLLVRSYVRLQRVAPGFDPRNVLAVGLNLPGIRYDSTHKVLAFFEALERDVRGTPGVEAASVTSEVPLGGPSWSSQFAVEGWDPIPPGSHVVHREMSPEYQRVMRVPLRKGRLLTPADRQGAPLVVVVNEMLVKSYFKDQDPIGKRISFDRLPDSNSTWRTIVGVVGDERQTGLGTETRPEFQAPIAQDPRNGLTLVVRTRGSLADLTPAVRRIVATLDPLLAISSVRSMEDVRAASLGRDRFLTVLMLAFSGVGLVLCLVGVYGVVAQLAQRRTREMGIRIALGANAGQVQWLVVRHGMLITSLGIVAGVAVAIGTTWIIRSLLYQVAPVDPVTFVAVPALVLLTAVLASWLPAERASSADPCQVLRSD